MTSKQLESINRRKRVVDRIRSGEAYGSIAASENISHEYVSEIGISAGIRVSPATKIYRLKETVRKRNEERLQMSESADNHEHKHEWGIATLILAAQSALDHCEELADAWTTGAIGEHDGEGGTRSNRNHDVAIRLRKALNILGKNPPTEDDLNQAQKLHQQPPIRVGSQAREEEKDATI